MNWRPLSLRDAPDPRFDTPSEGLPAWIVGPVEDWVRASFRYKIGPAQKSRWQIHDEALISLQLALRLLKPLIGEGERRLADLQSRIADNENGFGLDALDWMLHNPGRFNYRKTDQRHWAERLDAILRDGGSAWEVSQGTGDGFQLTRRAVGPVVEVLEQTADEATRAHAHLEIAWSKLMGRSPDPSGAYREAIRAVEAVAKPVILPNDSLATLGKMIGTVKKEPEKWSTTLGEIGDVRAQMQAVWKGQLDRHGTDDEEIPLNVSREEADAAFAICLDLVRQFVGGHVRPASASTAL
jgi:hypothetical protein